MLNPSSMTMNGKQAIILLFVGAIDERYFGYTNVLSTQTVPLKCMLEGGAMTGDTALRQWCASTQWVVDQHEQLVGESGKYDERP
jgi:hypothetical protein